LSVKSEGLKGDVFLGAGITSPIWWRGNRCILPIWVWGRRLRIWNTIVNLVRCQIMFLQTAAVMPGVHWTKRTPISTPLIMH